MPAVRPKLKKFKHYLRDFVLPHAQTHQKAHLLTWHGYIIFILLFILSQTTLHLLGQVNPGILGVNSSITVAEIVELSNQERAKHGVPPLKIDTQLSEAAAGKASNMFGENYWAHYSPSGKTPWDFINGAGYRFSYAGENLARSFSTSQEVVNAWMASPTHRDNLLNPKYEDIGVAVVDGVLDGQNTTLVVQEFGTRASLALAKAPEVTKAAPVASSVPVAAAISEIVPQDPIPVATPMVEAVTGKTVLPGPTIDPYWISKMVGLAILGILALLMATDSLVIWRRGVHRINSSHLLHFSMIVVAMVALFTLKPGIIF